MTNSPTPDELRRQYERPSHPWHGCFWPWGFILIVSFLISAGIVTGIIWWALS